MYFCVDLNFKSKPPNWFTEYKNKSYCVVSLLQTNLQPLARFKAVQQYLCIMHVFTCT